MQGCSLGGDITAEFISKDYLKFTLKKDGEAENVFYLTSAGVDKLAQFIVEYRKRGATRLG